MDYLQYASTGTTAEGTLSERESFKPCYKWITFNTFMGAFVVTFSATVLNLVINGLPSIHQKNDDYLNIEWYRFKPCYKWITFNTFSFFTALRIILVLNLVINGLPSIHKTLNNGITSRLKF